MARSHAHARIHAHGGTARTAHPLTGLAAWLEMLAAAAQCAIMFGLLLFSLVYTPTFVRNGEGMGPAHLLEVMNFNKGVPSEPFFLALAAFLGLMMVMSTLLARLPRHVMFGVVLAFVLVAQLTWVFALGLTSYTYPDSVSLTDAATTLLHGDKARFSPDYCTPGNMPAGCEQLPALYAYFSWYPFQSGPMLWYILVYKLFGIGNVLAFQVMNAFLITGVVAVLWWFASALGLGRRGMASFGVLCCTCMPLLMYCTFVYTNGVGLFLVLLGALLIGKALTAHSPIAAAGLMVVAFLVLGVGMLIKTTYAIMLLAALIAIVLVLLRRGTRYWLALVAAPMAWVAKTIAGSSVTFLERWSGQTFDRNLPTLSWIAIGLSRPQNGLAGWWGPTAVNTWVASNGDQQAQLGVAKDTIRTTLTTFLNSPMEAVHFFVEKLTSEWSEPTFMTSIYSETGTSSNGFTGLAGLVIDPNRNAAVLGYENVTMSVMYLLSFIGIVGLVRTMFAERKRSLSIDADGTAANPLAAVYARSFLVVTFLGGFLCYVVWEAKGIYTLPFYLLLIPIAAYGADMMTDGALKLIAWAKDRRAAVAGPQRQG